MRSALRKLARINALKGQQRARQAVTMLRMFRKDPRANDFLRFEAERVLRSSIYHMRQVAVIEALLERDAVQPFLVRIPRPRRSGELRSAEPRRDAARSVTPSVRRSGRTSSR
ncbi:MAG: hypothetical protein J7556_13020 [Acidovorax sp.]|nr:hypothetical protein [Acidovorax sp.]